LITTLRNAYAHANGRVEMLNTNIKKDIVLWEKQNLGISSYNEWVICEAQIVRDIFDAVRASLEDLVDRYKHNYPEARVNQR
jgi:hypothetical protein